MILQVPHTVPLNAHSAALRAVALDAVMGAAMGNVPDQAALDLQDASAALDAGDACLLRSVLARADAPRRALILEHVHPSHWERLGCQPADMAQALRAYEARFAA